MGRMKDADAFFQRCRDWDAVPTMNGLLSRHLGITPIQADFLRRLLGYGKVSLWSDKTNRRSRAAARGLLTKMDLLVHYVPTVGWRLTDDDRLALYLRIQRQTTLLDRLGEGDSQ